MAFDQGADQPFDARLRNRERNSLRQGTLGRTSAFPLFCDPVLMLVSEATCVQELFGYS